jgi:hypothetical protein
MTPNFPLRTRLLIMFAKSAESSAVPRGDVHPTDGAAAGRAARTRRVVRLTRVRRVRDCAPAVPMLLMETSGRAAAATRPDGSPDGARSRTARAAAAVARGALGQETNRCIEREKGKKKTG